VASEEGAWEGYLGASGALAGHAPTATGGAGANLTAAMQAGTEGATPSSKNVPPVVGTTVSGGNSTTTSNMPDGTTRIDHQFFNWHWDRNKFNDPSKATVEVSPHLSRYHRHGAESNKKYVSPDGHHEAVRNSKGELETHSSNIGTYNYYPYWNPRHGPADVIPYWIWGNAHDDPVDAWSRIVGPSGIQ